MDYSWTVGSDGLTVGAAGGRSNSAPDEGLLATLDYTGTHEFVSGLSLYLYAQGQLTLGKPVVSVSECTYGGRVVGRGYEIGSMSGDDCFMAASELRWTRTLGSSRQLQLYTFVDAGRVSQQGELEIGEASTRTAQSRGLGARLELGGRLMAHLEAVSSTKAEYTERGESSPRVYFSLTSRL